MLPLQQLLLVQAVRHGLCGPNLLQRSHNMGIVGLDHGARIAATRDFCVYLRGVRVAVGRRCVLYESVEVIHDSGRDSTQDGAAAGGYGGVLVTRSIKIGTLRGAYIGSDPSCGSSGT